MRRVSVLGRSVRRTSMRSVSLRCLSLRQSEALALESAFDVVP